MIRLLAVVLVASLMALGGRSSADAATGECQAGGTLQTIASDCWIEQSQDQGGVVPAGQVSPYDYQPSCELGGQFVCAEHSPCAEVGADGETYRGFLYDVVLDGEVVGQTCVTDAPGEPNAPPQVTPGMVLRAFQRLEWPASELTIQPPNGRTAVNFDTYFFTDDTAPLTQTVTLLGQRVTIEATPTSFTWRYGDDATETTSTPGGPYPGGTVVHQYLQAGATAPSLDTTYTGRYRVGGGPWVGIPDSLTVTGAPQQLEIVEIDLKLVYDY